MTECQIHVGSDPGFGQVVAGAVGNLRYDETLILDDVQLSGIATVLDMFFPYTEVRQPDGTMVLQMSPFVRVILQDGSVMDYDAAARNLDPVTGLPREDQSPTILLEGGDVDRVSADNWMINLIDLTGPNIQPYTLKVIVDKPAASPPITYAYLVQFDSMEFLDAMLMILQRLGLDARNYFVDFRQNGNPATMTSDRLPSA